MVQAILVDDDEDIALMASMVASDVGIQLLHAPDGESGLELIREYPEAVVILDLEMPGMHGKEVLRELDHSHGRVIVFTSNDEDPEELRAMGACSYARKPTNVDELQGTLAAMLKAWPNTKSMEAAISKGEQTFPGGAERFRAYAERASQTMTMRMALLPELARAQDWGELQRITHMMAPHAGMLGQPELAEALRRIEDACKQCDPTTEIFATAAADAWHRALDFPDP